MTNEKMPSDSAKTTMMMPFVRIAFAASGLRPVASATFEPAMPIPRPAPSAPKPIAMPAPSQARLICEPPRELGRVGRGDICFLVHGMLFVLSTVRLERKDDVEEHEEREHERLNEADEQLEPEEREHEARYEEQRGKHGQHDLAAPDVAPETERQGEDAEELREELDESDEDHHHSDERAVPEAREVDPTREIADAVLADARGLVPDESGEREAEVGVVVGGR